MQRRVYCVGLRKHVEAEIDDIVSITGKRGTKYQCVGKYSENGKDYVVKSWVPKADYEALHGSVVEIEDVAAAEEFIGADVEAAEPLVADPVADSPVAEDSSEPLEVAPADKSYFLSESVVLSAIKEMAAEDYTPGTTYNKDPDNYDHYDVGDYLLEVEGKIIEVAGNTQFENFDDLEISNEDLDVSGWKIIKITGKNPVEWEVYDELAPMGDEISYECISCGEEIDERAGHELVGEFQEKCCLHCFNSAFGAEDECSSCKDTGISDYYAPCELCMGNMEFDDIECRECHGSGASDFYAPCEECSLSDDWDAEQTFEATAQTKERKDHVSEQAALRLIKGAYGVKRIVSGPTYYRFVEGTSSGRRGATFPTLWMSDPYPTEAQAERASRAKQKKKSRKGYIFLDAEEFRAFMAEHFNSEDKVCEHCGRPYSVCLDTCDEMWLPCTQEKCVCQS